MVIFSGLVIQDPCYPPRIKKFSSEAGNINLGAFLILKLSTILLMGKKVNFRIMKSIPKTII